MNRPRPLVVIAGSSGAIGSRLANSADAFNLDVLRLPRETVDFIEFTPQLRNRKGRSRVILVIAAGWAPPRDPNPEYLAEANINLMASLARFSCEAKVSAVVNLSTISVYENLANRDEISAPITRESPYGLSKYFGEQVLNSLVDHCPIYHLRLPGVIGKDIGNSALSKILYSLRKNQDITLHSRSSLYNSVISVDEIGRFVNKCAQSDIDESYRGLPLNFAASAPLKFEDFISLLLKRTGSMSKINWIGDKPQSSIPINRLRSATQFSSMSVTWHAERACDFY